ncbi:MAG: hypothetical protein HY290_10425 [Planctomycetia bacterium]|nr:hypothetical protein [Planctomycetia bacterium]
MNRELVWAIVRLVLGALQVIAAAAGVILLFRTGVNSLSLGVAAVGGILTLTSILLFRQRKTKQ